MKRKDFASAGTNVVSILMFFLSFYAHFFIGSYDLVTSFIRGCITMLVAMVVVRLIFFIWQFSLPTEEWQYMVQGEPIFINKKPAHQHKK